MSYITINLGGKPRGLKFNQLAIELIGQYNDSKTTTGFLYAMIYGGLKGNAYVKREELELTFEEVCDMIDELPNKETIVGEVTKTLSETQIWKELVKQGEEAEAEEKKKATESMPTTT
jgi:hypothetical protein